MVKQVYDLKLLILSLLLIFDILLREMFHSYTWKIYANKVLNMGSIYSFWRQLNKEEKQAKQRYIQMFYSLQFRNLASLKRDA